MFRLLAPLLAVALLAACQLSLPGRDRGADATANTATGSAITTTTLDTPPPGNTDATAASQPAPPGAPRPLPRPSEPGATTPETTPDPPGDPTPEPAAQATPPEPAPEVPAALKTPGQIACEDDGGNWARAGEGGGMACVFQTRDGGRRCDSKDDCQGECLARSRTCSPIRPLFGCNAVLLDTGAEVTLCLD